MDKSDILLDKLEVSGKKVLTGKGVAFGFLPEVILYSGFAALSFIFAFSLATAPILMLGGIGLGAVFVLQAVYGILTFKRRKSLMGTKKNGEQIEIIDENQEETNKELLRDKMNNYEELTKNGKNPLMQTVINKSPKKRAKGAPRFVGFLSFMVLGISLMLLGIALFTAPAAFLGSLVGLSFAVKIGVIVTGAIFLAKGLTDYIKMKGEWEDLKKCRARRRVLSNLFDLILYGASAGLGIAAMITSGFAFIPAVFTAVFAMYALASVLHMFSHLNLFSGIGRVARCLEAVALGAMGLTLIVSGIAFAPLLVGTFGLPATVIGMSSILFAQIASIFMGALFIALAACKISMGTVLNFFNFKAKRLIQSDMSMQEFVTDKRFGFRPITLEDILSARDNLQELPNEFKGSTTSHAQEDAQGQE